MLLTSLLSLVTTNVTYAIYSVRMLCLAPSQESDIKRHLISPGVTVIIGGGSWGLGLSTFVLAHPFSNVLLNTPCVLGRRLRVKHRDTTTA